MKTTSEQRARYKEKRRMRGIRNLVAMYLRKIRTSQRTHQTVFKFIDRNLHHPCLHLIDEEVNRTLRRAN